MKLGRDAVLEYGDLESKIAIAEHAPAVRAAFEFLRNRGMSMLRGTMFVRSVIVVA